MKICSLLPSGTEILFVLGLGDQVIGVTDLCDYPDEARNKPIVCRSKIDVSVLSSEQVEEEMRRILSSGESPYDLDQQWLLDNSPDVVLTQDLCYFCEVDAGAVNRAVQGIPKQPQVMVLNPRTLEEIFQSICRVGEVCGAAEKAEQLVSSLRDRTNSIRQKLAAVAKFPRVFSLEGINPLVIGGHWIPELLQLAGGAQDLYPPGCPAARIQWQEVLEYAPEKLYIDLCSSDLDRQMREISWLARQDGWYDLPAVQSGEVYLIDHVYFSRPGPRVVQGLEILAQLTHPEVFSENVPANTVAKLDASLVARTNPDQLAACFRPFAGTVG
ncbi:MAG: ABC transporter substrate-binding protein [Chloroflexi bacterium]|nr:ABC transporter substrate-binding protein [Chloroflexota bacterium]MDA1219398.1 ABC transporter substrate-binding protein [Chloroflexota bacterium]